MSGGPCRLGAALHDSATVWEFGSKLMRVPGLIICGGRAGQRPPSWPGMHTAGAVCFVGRVLSSDAASGVRGFWGIGMRTRWPVGRAGAIRCVVIAAIYVAWRRS
jgi:hypothetical protein